MDGNNIAKRKPNERKMMDIAWSYKKSCLENVALRNFFLSLDFSMLKYYFILFDVYLNLLMQKYNNFIQ